MGNLGAGGSFSNSPITTPIPDVSRYGQAGLLAKTAYQNTLARINRNRSQLIRQYGYAGDVDPNTGVLTNLRVDTHNPYGNLQSMYRTHAAQAQEAAYGAQERGLRGGLAHKADADLRYQRGMESSQLGTSLTDTLADYQEQQQSARYDFDRALYEAQLEAARNAIGNQDFNPASPDPGQYPPPGGDPGGVLADRAGSALAKWLAGQAAAAGQWRQDKPRGIRGIYVL